MNIRPVGFVLGLLVLSAQACAAGKCELKQIAELPVTMQGRQPLLDIKINGQGAKFIVDSGAFWTNTSAANASRYGLKLRELPYSLHVSGVGGQMDAKVATVQEFGLLSYTLKRVDIIVGGSESGYDGVLGQNLLQHYDVEYDLGHGAIRLFEPDGCQKTRLAYWVQPGQEFSAMPIDYTTPQDPQPVGTGTLNGQRIRIMFDTGASVSVLASAAAAHAGIVPGAPGVVDGGESGGVGRKRIRTYIASFDSLKIGDGEEIQHAKLRFADLGELRTDLLLGADFFIAHRVFVGNKEHQLFLTFNGGQVFDLSRREAAPATPPQEGAAPGLQSVDATVTDPAELARRGSALAARRDFVPAIADLSRAVDLAPDNPEYYYQRANAYWGSGDGEKALADFNHVIALKHDFLPAYIPRAELNLARKDRAAAVVDLDTVNELAPKQADLRLMLAEMQQKIGNPDAALEQYGLWIAAHRDDSRVPQARGARCLVSALANKEIKAALDDCDTALRHMDKSVPIYGNIYIDRGLVQLRLGDNRHALADFEQALKLMPQNPRAYYGRAVAEAHLGKSSESTRDLAQAQKLGAADIKRLQFWGFTP